MKSRSSFEEEEVDTPALGERLWKSVSCRRGKKYNNIWSLFVTDFTYDSLAL